MSSHDNVHYSNKKPLHYIKDIGFGFIFNVSVPLTDKMKTNAIKY